MVNWAVSCINSLAYQVCNLKLKQGSVTIKAAVTKYRVEILRNAGVSDKVSQSWNDWAYSFYQDYTKV